MKQPPPVTESLAIKRQEKLNVLNAIYNLVAERKQIALFERELEDLNWPIGVHIEFGNKIIESEATIDDILAEFNIRTSPEYTYVKPKD